MPRRRFRGKPIMSSLILMGTHNAKLVPLSGKITTIGRGGQCDVVIDHPRVSRRHATVSLIDGVVHVNDLDSRNGTFVNGVRVRRQLLKNRDVIRIGDSDLRYLDASNKLESIDSLNLVV
jgi:pSer/pThr/pTyr-binding forkhead associated (FHA) protein